MHRVALTLGLSILLSASSTLPTIAQGTPASGEGMFAGLGLPELVITVTDTGLQPDQTEIPAGRYLVTLEAGDAPNASAGFVRLAEGKTLEDLSWADEMAAGTPAPEEGPPIEDLAWIFETYVSGGPSAINPQVVVNLPAGEYGIWADDQASPMPAQGLTVTGDPDPAAISGPEPEPAVTIEQIGTGGKGFTFGVDGELTAGPQIVKIVNGSDQPHFTSAFQYPEPITIDQVMASIMFDPSSGATPAPDLLDLEQTQFVAFVAAQSAGTVTWTVLDLQPGQVGLECWIPDPLAGGVPHALEGMIQLFDVAQA